MVAAQAKRTASTSGSESKHLKLTSVTLIADCLDTITGAEARAYERAVRDWNDHLRAFCAAGGIGLVSTTTDVPFGTIVQSILRRGGLVS